MKVIDISFGDIVKLPSGSMYRADDNGEGYTNWVRTNNAPDDGAADEICPEAIDVICDRIDAMLKRSE